MKWTVRTQVVVERTYVVEATDEKDAVAQSTFVTPVDEEEFNEETLSVRPVEPGTNV